MKGFWSEGSLFSSRQVKVTNDLRYVVVTLCSMLLNISVDQHLVTVIL